MPCDESEAWFTTFLLKNEFYLHVNENHFHMKGCARSLPFITRHKATRKWLIDIMALDKKRIIVILMHKQKKGFSVYVTNKFF